MQLSNYKKNETNINKLSNTNTYNGQSKSSWNSPAAGE
jgi:hypothetical protein